MGRKTILQLLQHVGVTRERDTEKGIPGREDPITKHKRKQSITCLETNNIVTALSSAVKGELLSALTQQVV